MRYVHHNGGCAGSPLPVEVTAAIPADAAPVPSAVTAPPKSRTAIGQLADRLESLFLGRPRAVAASPAHRAVMPRPVHEGDTPALPIAGFAVEEEEWIVTVPAMQAEGGEMPRME